MEKSCQNCKQAFEVDQEDQKYYQKNSLPLPTFCPTCRHLRRLAFRNERALYPNTCALCKQSIIAVFPKDTDFTVYCNSCWWSDKWDPMDYATDYDPSQPFFSQYQKFTAKIPRLALYQDGTSENCQYTNYGLNNKNCYLALGAFSQDCYYCHGMVSSKNCMDCFKVVSCELCYQCIDCKNCYNLLFSKDCISCSDSYFLADCKNSKNCFLSAGLDNAQYVFENQQLTKEEYQKRLNAIEFTPENIQKFSYKLAALNLQVPKKAFNGSGNENVTGNAIDSSKNLKQCYDAVTAQDSAYSYYFGLNSHDIYDASYATGCEFCHEINGATAFNNCKFVYYGRHLSDCDYSQHCYNSSNLFACYGLNHKQYCIFNKQYSPEEYFALREQIIADMRRSQEYGEFFPANTSDFAYNESVAHEYAPLTEEQAAAKGLRWHHDEFKNSQSTPGAKSCRTCHRNFKIISQESALYKKFKLPTPEICPECRHKIRFVTRPPQTLHTRPCDHCQTPIQTTYTPERPEKVYCEDCYSKQ